MLPDGILVKIHLLLINHVQVLNHGSSSMQVGIGIVIISTLVKIVGLVLTRLHVICVTLGLKAIAVLKKKESTV